MLDATTMENQIALLEIRLTNAMKLLEHQLILTNRTHEAAIADAQKSHAQETLTGMCTIQSQLAVIEKKLANDTESWKMPQSFKDEEVIAELLASVKDFIVKQLAKQSEQISELEERITSQQVEHSKLLAQVEAHVTSQIEECSLQVAVLIQDVSNFQKQEYRVPVSALATPASSNEATSVDEPYVNRTSDPQEDKATAEFSKTASTELSSSVQHIRKTKDMKLEQVQPLASSTIHTEGEYFTIDGVSKKLLLPKEALEIARKHGFKGDYKALGKLSRPSIKPEVYRLYGLGVVPELRGGRGIRNAWYYQL